MDYLFSYGTLQDEAVQVAIFGRVLTGEGDALLGFRQDWIEVTDAEVLETSGKTHHPIVTRTDKVSDRVSGTVFALTAEDIRRADLYEVDDYVRVRVSLASGKTAWLYQAHQL